MSNKLSKQTLADARAVLEELAATGRTLNYREFASVMGIDISPVILTTTYLLEIIVREDFVAQRPVLSSVVIQKGKSGIPRKGFFMLLEELGLYQGDYDNAQAAQWHLNELKKLKLYYQK